MKRPHHPRRTSSLFLRQSVNSSHRLAAATRSLIESLEARTLMSVTQDADGWTVVTPSADSRMIYVSSSRGDDANSGLAPDAPLQTIAAAQLLLRSGYPDHLLLRRGDAWNHSFGSFGPSGRNADEPMVIAAYGEGPRPLVKTGGAGVMNTNGRATHDLFVQGIHFHANGRDVNSPDFVGTGGSDGFALVGKNERILIEDSVIDSFSMNIEVNDYKGRPNDIRIRRNTIVNSYAAPGGTSSGVYISDADNALIEGNVIDHNGWHPTLAGMNAYGHNIYLQGNTSGMRVIDNIIANGGSHGLQARSGGEIRGNLFVRNPIHMSFGLVNSGPAVAGGVTGEVSDNVFLEGRRFADPNTNRGEGWALEIANIKAGGNVAIRNNVFAHNNSGQSYAIRLDVGAPTNAAEAVGINDLLIEGNTTFMWYRGLWTSSKLINGGTGPTAFNNVTVRDNDLQTLGSSRLVHYGHPFDTAQSHWSGQRYFDGDPTSGWFNVDGATTSLETWKANYEPTAAHERVSYKNPYRTTATYNGLLGGTASHEAFMAEAKLQSRLAWREAYTAQAAADYIRDGFGMGVATAPPPPSADATPPTAVLSVDGITTAGGTGHTFTITYDDGSGIDVASLGNDDVRVTGPNSYSQFATLVSVDATAGGTARTATYRITAPGGTWDTIDSGAYAVALKTGAVTDAAGVAAQGGTLGWFQVAIAPPPTTPSVDTTPPTVVQSSFVRTSPDKLIVTFSEDVSRTLSTSDLLVKRGTTTISSWRIKLGYDEATNTATFAFTGYPRGRLPSGSYVATLRYGEIRDAARNQLDGDSNGVSGPDYVYTFKV